MRRYIYDKRGVYFGRYLDITEYDTYPFLSTLVEPPTLSDGEYAKWTGDEWSVITDIPVKPPVVPQSVTMRQFKLALIEAGVFDSVEDFIVTLTGVDYKKAMVEWNGAFAERSSPSISTYGAGLGMTSEDVDNLFILADTL